MGNERLGFTFDVVFRPTPNSGKARCELGWHWKPKPLHDFDLWYAMSGSGQMRLRGRTYPIRKGSCFVVKPGDEPEAVQDPDDRLTVIYMHFNAVERGVGSRFDPDKLPGPAASVSDTFEFEMMLGRLLQCAHQHGLWHEDEYDLVMKQVMLHLFRLQQAERDTSAADKQSGLIGKVKAYIREEPGRRLTNRELADLVKLSPEYLSILFKKHTGTSLKSYMTDVRLERSMHLLMETPMNVTEVAEALGYANVYLFSRLFKERYGEPPSRFKWKSEHARPHGGSGDK